MVDSKFSAWSRSPGEISTPSFHFPIKKTIRMFRAVYVVANASLMDWKFSVEGHYQLRGRNIDRTPPKLRVMHVLKLLDILDPAMERWPMWRK